VHPCEGISSTLLQRAQEPDPSGARLCQLSAKTTSEKPKLEGGSVIYQTLLREFPFLLKGVLVALELLLAFMLLGIIIGLILAVMEVYGNRWSSTLALMVERFFRGVPAVVLIFLFYYGLSDIYNVSSFAAATLALGLRTGAYQSQIFKGAIQAVGSGQMEAARSLGMGKIQAISSIILPQALRFAIGPWSNEFASELKDTSLAYTIGVVELLRRAKYIVSYTYGNALIVYGFCAILYLILVRLGNVVLYRIESRLQMPGFEMRREGRERVRVNELT
jgi:polar amino acid transport system permease protein